MFYKVPWNFYLVIFFISFTHTFILNINTVSLGLSTTHALLYFKPKTICNVHLYINLATQNLNLLSFVDLGNLVGSTVYSQYGQMLYSPSLTVFRLET